MMNEIEYSPFPLFSKKQNIVAAFWGMHVSHGNIAMLDYQESLTTRQTHRQTDRQTDARQIDPYVPLRFAGDTKTAKDINWNIDGRMDRWISLLHMPELLCNPVKKVTKLWKVGYTT